MAYRFTGTDPFLRASIGAFNGYVLRSGNPLSGAILLKRASTGTWMGGHVIDQGSTTNWAYIYELNPTDHMISDFTAGTVAESGTALTDTTNFEILGFRWTGGTGAGGWVWEWKIGGGSWVTESDTVNVGNLVAGAAGSGYRHLIGNEAGLGDDANFDVVCVGLIQSNLSQVTFESLDMLSFATWTSVFAGSGAWLLGFDTLATQTDRTGNGGNELSRSSGITLVSDPAGWSWGGVAANFDYPPVRGRHPFFLRPGSRMRRASALMVIPSAAVNATITAVPAAATAAGITSVPKIDVPMTAAAATASAPAATPTVAATATYGQATAAAIAPVPNVAATATPAAATAAGITATPSISATATPAAATGSAPAPTPTIAVTVTYALATASAPAAAIVKGTLVNATPGTATAAGIVVTPKIAVSVLAAAALAAGNPATVTGTGSTVATFFDQPTPAAGYDSPTLTAAAYDQPTPTDRSFDG